jgi:hypothetical protein
MSSFEFEQICVAVIIVLDPWNRSRKDVSAGSNAHVHSLFKMHSSTVNYTAGHPSTVGFLIQHEFSSQNIKHTHYNYLNVAPIFGMHQCNASSSKVAIILRSIK